MNRIQTMAVGVVLPASRRDLRLERSEPQSVGP
jgi:hypothetical protein